MKKIEDYSIIPQTVDETAIEILLVDDRTFTLQYLSLSLEAEKNIKIVGTAQNGKEAIAQVELLRPAIVIIDLEMPEMNGIEATEIIGRRFTDCKVLVLSSYATSDYLQDALRAGAKGYLLKGSPIRELVNAIYSVYLGYTQLSPGLMEKVLTPEVEVLPQEELETDWAESTRETVDALPKVSLRALLYILLISLMGIVPWIVFAKIDEIVTVRGKFEPVKIINLDAPVSGRVTQIAVKEGEKVKAKQPIVELDSQLVDRKLQEQQQQLAEQQDKLDRLDMLKNQQSSALRTLQNQNEAQQSAKQAAIDRARQAIETSNSERELAIIRYQAAVEKVPRYQEAYEVGGLSLDLLSEAKQEVREHQDSIEQLTSNLARARSQLAEQQRELDLQTDNMVESKSKLNDTETQIATLQTKIAQTNSAIEKLSDRMQQRIFYAPVEGTVFQLSVKTDAVVQVGQMVAQIAPQGSPLVLRGEISSRESKFLKVGLPAKVKFDADPFQDYGIILGRVTGISPDRNTANPSQSPTSAELSEFYEVEIELERNYLQDRERTITLTPGQTATAEVMIRQRRLVDIFLAPFKNIQDEVKL